LWWNATAEVRILESERGGLGERGQWSMLAFAAAAAASTAGRTRSSRGQAGSRTLHLNNIARVRNTRHKIERLRVADKAVTDRAGSGASVRKHTGTHAEREAHRQTERRTDDERTRADRVNRSRRATHDRIKQGATNRLVCCSLKRK